MTTLEFDEYEMALLKFICNLSINTLQAVDYDSPGTLTAVEATRIIAGIADLQEKLASDS